MLLHTHCTHTINSCSFNMCSLNSHHIAKNFDKCWGFNAAAAAAAAAKSLQSCPTLCDAIDGSPPGTPVPGILQARTLEWVTISFSNAWKWKVKGSRSVVSDSSRPHGLQPTRLLHPWDFPGKSTGVGCQCLLHLHWQVGSFPAVSPGKPVKPLLRLKMKGLPRWY